MNDGIQQKRMNKTTGNDLAVLVKVGGLLPAGFLFLCRKRLILVLFLFLLLSTGAIGQAVKAPYRLRTDLVLNTDKVSKNGIEANISLAAAVQQKDIYQFAAVYRTMPVFNWETDTSIKHTIAFRILLASSQKLLDQNKPDYWDSKKISSTHNQVFYNGIPLEPGKIYYWKVQVWNGRNEPTPFSATTAFFLRDIDTTGLFAYSTLTATTENPLTVIKNQSGRYFLDFGKDAFAQIQLQLFSDKEDSIWIRAGEALESPGNIQKTGGNIRYTRRGLLLKKGMHDYTINWPPDAKRNSRNPVQMPAYIGEVFPFRYVEIENFEGLVNKASVRRKTITYPFDESSSAFISSDSVLNKVWDLCRYSVKATSFSGYYVDGDRERLPYEADALINQLSHYSVDAEYSMARRSMAFLLFHPTWPTEWSLQNILLAWNDYLYTGDKAFLQKYYAELQKKILMPLAGDNGLISTRTNKQTDAFLESIHMVKDFDGKHGLKDNVDWPQKSDYTGNEKEYKGETDGFVYTDYNAVVNAYYYRCLVLMQKIAGVLEKKEDTGFYGAESKKLYHSFQQVFRDGHSGLIKDGDTTAHTSLHANMFALAFGLVPDNDVAKVVAFIKTRKMACSVYGAQFLLDALYDAGEGEYALQLLTATTQRSWYNMLRVGSTITMEAWDKVYKPNLDLNHAWGSAPANIIVRKLMGVEPLTPGCDLIQIKPQLGGLTFASLKTRTIKGMIEVNFKKNKKEEITEVIIPGSCSANVILKINSKNPLLMTDEKNTTTQQENGYFVIKGVGPGKHIFRMQ
jgi:hypothetical protein